MQTEYKKFSIYELIGELIEELKLREYSYKTGNKYIDITINS